MITRGRHGKKQAAVRTQVQQLLGQFLSDVATRAPGTRILERGGEREEGAGGCLAVRRGRRERGGVGACEDAACCRDGDLEEQGLLHAVP